MDRRRVITALALGGVAIASRAFAQQKGKVYRIGVLELEGRDKNPNFQAFREGLRELGYTEGRNVVFEYRSIEGLVERYRPLAAELVRLNVDLILTRGTPGVIACKEATHTIPIVMTGVGNPVGDLLVASLAHPGGNVTGFSAATTELSAKRLQLLRELLPRISRIGALMNMGNPNLPGQYAELTAAAKTHGITAVLIDVRSTAGLKKGFEEGARQRLDALYVGLDGVTRANRKLIADLALEHRLPTVTAAADYVDAGALASYGANYAAIYRNAASIADKIFKGAKPADIPVQLPYDFEMSINVKTAKALGIAPPKDLLARADRVIN